MAMKKEYSTFNCYQAIEKKDNEKKYRFHGFLVLRHSMPKKKDSFKRYNNVKKNVLMLIEEKSKEYLRKNKDVRLYKIPIITRNTEWVIENDI